MDFVPVTTYGRQAEADAKFLRKGSPVTVAGRIRSWYDRDTKKGGFTFEANSVKYQGRRGAGGDTGTDADSGGLTEQGGQNSGAEDEWVQAYDRHLQDGPTIGGSNASHATNSQRPR